MAPSTKLIYFLTILLLLRMVLAADIDGSKRHAKILKTYKGMFFTKEQHARQEKRYEECREDMLKDQYFKGDTARTVPNNGDGDTCCQTMTTYSIHFSKEDITGSLKSIVQFPFADPPTYQFTRNVTCSTMDASCPKEQCFIEPFFTNMLVNGANGDVEFAWFQVPGYCSCKNISPIK